LEQSAAALVCTAPASSWCTFRSNGHPYRHPDDLPAGHPAAQQGNLLQNFGANLALLLGVIAGLTLIAYVVRVARDGSLQPPDQGA
jgi:hypothetical protein